MMASPLDVAAGGPLYQQLRQQLFSRIRRGEFGPGDLLPSESQLCEEYGVSVTTARRALLELVNEGVVQRRVGVGTMLAPSVRHAQLALVAADLDAGDPAALGALIRGIGAVARERSASFAVSAVVEARAVDGVLLLPSGEVAEEHLDVLEAAGTPYVVIGRDLRHRSVSCVVEDGGAAAALATGHLLQLGHRRIAFVGAQDLLRGYRETLEQAGVALDRRLVRLEPADGPDEARRAVAALLREPRRPTAVFAAGDALAAAACRAVREAGLRVPEDVALVSGGAGALADPPLTTVGAGWHELGRRAARLLLDLVEGRLEPPRRVVVEPRLVVRESSGTAPADVRELAAAPARPGGELAGRRVAIAGRPGPLADALAAAVRDGGGAVGEADASVDAFALAVDLREDVQAALADAQAAAERAAAAMARRGSGCVLVVAHRPEPDALAAAAGAGIAELVRGLAAAWSARGVRANGVLLDRPDLPGLPELCRFLLSEAAAALDGQVVSAGP
jgi:DNA-binding LacI/PurR family transcriptional regulator